ncbi:DUF6516 family protein [Haloarcula sp. S1CR25-12]|uniref:DUF6516 family protein n=1 Tax=Haloarcula saliterrae TaxID=2950534 RepID=A0ABU2FFH4_9EURY|nr:DUF6516 family protein [Haloarcula sp. S1CR25-12]MDS0261012.1 DUF6516 family protein [Haloarcula sp. S1CR25-12]
MLTEQPFQYTHVESRLVENVVVRRTDDIETYPSGWKYTLHPGTLEDLTLVRYTNTHEDTKGHEHHIAAGDVDGIEFPGMEERLFEFWASADEYWEAVDGGPERPY